MAITYSSISCVGRLPYRVYLHHNRIYLYVTSSDETSRFMCAPLVLRGKPGNEARLFSSLSVCCCCFFPQQQQQVAQAHQPSNPNVHSFSSCTVMSYSSHGGEGGRPSVYQASSSTLQAPRGVSLLAIIYAYYRICD